MLIIVNKLTKCQYGHKMPCNKGQLLAHCEWDHSLIYAAHYTQISSALWHLEFLDPLLLQPQHPDARPVPELS